MQLQVFTMILDKQVLILAYARFESSIIKCLHTNNWCVKFTKKVTVYISANPACLIKAVCYAFLHTNTFISF